MISPVNFVRRYNGQAIVYDPGYGVQCVGGFKVWCRDEGIPVIPCPSNFAESYWTCRNRDGSINSATYAWQTKYFTKITNPGDFRNGDWVVWPKGSSHPDSHIAMYYDGQEFGQRQYEDNRAFCLKNTNFKDAYGALRWIGYENYREIPYGINLLELNGHKYRIRRMTGTDKITVVAAGLNEVAPIKELDADVRISAKITGGNYFQMKTDIPDQPYGMTFGDLSAPKNGVYQSLPMQDSTLFYDLDTGHFGDCKDVNIDPTHSVFSPALVFPNSKGHWEYARMVGLSHKDYKSRYSFVLKVPDGYAVGIATEDMTPEEIANDFSFTDFENIAFLDGGGSAQMAYWENDRMNYERTDTDRATPSAVAIYRDFTDSHPQDEPGQPLEPEQPAEQPETGENQPDTGKEEEQPMDNEKPAEQPGTVPGWNDPDAGKKTVYDRFVALLAVKSIITIVCLALFSYLTIHEKISQDQFMTIFTAVIMFYFGTTFQKGAGQ